MRLHPVFLVLLFTAGTAAAVADPLYKWVDGQGHVHYSQTPPPGADTKAKAAQFHVEPPSPEAMQAAEAQAKAAEQPDLVAKHKHCDQLEAQLNAYMHSDDKSPDAVAARRKAMQQLNDQIAKECD